MFGVRLELLLGLCCRKSQQGYVFRGQTFVPSCIRRQPPNLPNCPLVTTLHDPATQEFRWRATDWCGFGYLNPGIFAERTVWDRQTMYHRPLIPITRAVQQYHLPVVHEGMEFHIYFSKGSFWVSTGFVHHRCVDTEGIAYFSIR